MYKKHSFWLSCMGFTPLASRSMPSWDVWDKFSGQTSSCLWAICSHRLCAFGPQSNGFVCKWAIGLHFSRPGESGRHAMFLTIWKPQSSHESWAAFGLLLAAWLLCLDLNAFDCGLLRVFAFCMSPTISTFLFRHKLLDIRLWGTLTQFEPN